MISWKDAYADKNGFESHFVSFLSPSPSLRINHAIGDLSCLMALFKDMTTPVSAVDAATSAADAATSAADAATSAADAATSGSSSSAPAKAEKQSWLLSTAIYAINTIFGLIDFLLMSVFRESRTCFINLGRVPKWGQAQDGSHLPTAVAFTEAMELSEVNRLRKKLNAVNGGASGWIDGSWVGRRVGGVVDG